jgi:hypothetical protein
LSASSVHKTSRPPGKKGDEQMMKAYYVKVIRQMFSLAVLTGFLGGMN